MSALSEATLDRGVSLLGSASGLHNLFAALEAAEPIRLGVVGASVGQNAGCLAQPGKRCMAYSGRAGSSGRGFAVRLLDHINRTYPHAGHSIANAALDATPAQNVADCLFSHLPDELHLVVLEFGSTANLLQLSAIERITRALLALRRPPALLTVSVHEWCSQKVTPRRLYRVGDHLMGKLRHAHMYVYL